MQPSAAAAPAHGHLHHPSQAQAQEIANTPAPDSQEPSLEHSPTSEQAKEITALPTRTVLEDTTITNPTTTTTHTDEAARATGTDTLLQPSPSGQNLIHRHTRPDPASQPSLSEQNLIHRPPEARPGTDRRLFRDSKRDCFDIALPGMGVYEFPGFPPAVTNNVNITQNNNGAIPLPRVSEPPQAVVDLTPQNAKEKPAHRPTQPSFRRWWSKLLHIPCLTIILSAITPIIIALILIALSFFLPRLAEEIPSTSLKSLSVHVKSPFTNHALKLHELQQCGTSYLNTINDCALNLAPGGTSHPFTSHENNNNDTRSCKSGHFVPSPLVTRLASTHGLITSQTEFYFPFLSHNANRLERAYESAHRAKTNIALFEQGPRNRRQNFDYFVHDRKTEVVRGIAKTESEVCRMLNDSVPVGEREREFWLDLLKREAPKKKGDPQVMIGRNSDLFFLDNNSHSPYFSREIVPLCTLAKRKYNATFARRAARNTQSTYQITGDWMAIAHRRISVGREYLPMYLDRQVFLPWAIAARRWEGLRCAGDHGYGYIGVASQFYEWVDVEARFRYGDDGDGGGIAGGDDEGGESRRTEEEEEARKTRAAYEEAVSFNNFELVVWFMAKWKAAWIPVPTEQDLESATPSVKTCWNPVKARPCSV